LYRSFTAPHFTCNQILFGEQHMFGFEDSFPSEDSQLARRVKLFLASQPRASLRYLKVEADGGAVTLRGFVATFYERQLALLASRQVAGVRQLIDEITVQEVSAQEFTPQLRSEFTGRHLASDQLAAV
jgi:hypothetical protein